MLAQKVTRAMGDKCKATLLDSSNNSCLMEPPPKARWYSPPPPRANKPRLAAGNSAMLRWTPAYAGVVAGRRVTVANAGVDSSAQLPNKSGASGEGNGGRHVESSRRIPSRPNPQRAGHHRAQQCWRTLGHSRRSFLGWIRVKTAGKLVQMKGEYLMLVSDTAGGFRATIWALRSHGKLRLSYVRMAWSTKGQEPSIYAHTF
jgi:hypothetical protein